MKEGLSLHPYGQNPRLDIEQPVYYVVFGTKTFKFLRCLVALLVPLQPLSPVAVY